MRLADPRLLPGFLIERLDLLPRPKDHEHVTRLQHEIGRRVRDHGLEMHPYTVRATRLPAGYADAGAYMRYLFDDLRATGVFTDNPDLFPRR